MKNKQNKNKNKNKNNNNEVIEKKINTTEKGKDYYEELENKNKDDVNSNIVQE